MQWFFQFRLMLLCTDNCNAHWIMNRVGKWCGSVVSKMLVEITSQGTPAKLEVTVYLWFPSMAVTLKIYDAVVVERQYLWRQYSNAGCLCGKHLTAQQPYTLIFYMPVVLSLGISSASQTFFFTATSQAPPLWHFIYITISRIQGLERFCTNKIKIALTDWSVQWMWDWHTLKGQTSEHTV